MRSLLEFVGANTSVEDLWVWGFPEAMRSRAFISDVCAWKDARPGFA